MIQQSIPGLLLLTVLPIKIVKAQEGISVIPPEELYEKVEDFNDIINCLRNREILNKCMKKSEYHTDFACRYDRNVRTRCYCCGANYKYIEYGRICTRFCLKSQPSEPKYGKYPIIILPFNWGDAGRPDSASLEDGSDFPIIPVNANLSRLIYGFESDVEILKPVTYSLLNGRLRNDLAEALPSFTKQMFLELTKQKTEENLVFSPISLHSVLALLYSGSEQSSVTKEELGNALGLTRNEDLLKSQYKKLIRFMKKQKEILYGNEIFVSSSVTANPEFARNVYKNFGTNISYFLDDHIENSVKKINKIISIQTNGKIDTAIEEIDYNTKLLMINTLFFEGRWAVPFEYSERRNNFTTPNGRKEVEMMEVSTEGIRINKLKIGPGKKGTEIEIIHIPKIDKSNKPSNYELRIVMGPEQFGPQGLEVLIDLMTRDEESNIFLENNGEEIYGEVGLMLPQFSMRSKLDVSDYLKNIGVNKIFTEAAELTKIAYGPDNLSVTKILQEVVLNVDKHGTEAAVATIAQITTYSADEPVVRRVDRPFILMLWDKENNIPLIVGMINDPTLSS